MTKKQWILGGIALLSIGTLTACGTVNQTSQNHKSQREQFGKPTCASIPTIIRSFKSAATKRINEEQDSSGCPVWQRNYYEHIIRDDGELNRIRQYIHDNPANWISDGEEPKFHL